MNPVIITAIAAAIIGGLVAAMSGNKKKDTKSKITNKNKKDSE